ncbi:MAG: hypothetical protein ACI90U_002663 [Pseudomonadales bacterium]|jgi:hypothetical protein
MGLHFNSGDYFKRPHESELSCITRFMVANRGLSQIFIDKYLKTIFPEITGFKQRVLAYQGFESSNQIATQLIGEFKFCPKCAQIIFHTDIFNIPWITHCPIHHCKLTAEIPSVVCLDDNTKKDGTIDYSAQNITSEPELVLTDVDFKIIKKLDNLFRDWLTKNYYYLEENLSQQRSIPSFGDGWYEISPKDRYYPTILTIKDKKVTHKLLQSLKIPISPVRVIIFNKYEKINPIYEGEDFFINNYSPKLIAKMARVKYLTLTRILRWIAKQCPKGHRSKVFTLKSIRLKDLLKAPKSCKFCTALSVYFFYVESFNYSLKIHNFITIRDYPFLINSENNRNFYHPFQFFHPLIIEGYLNYEERFIEWFYQRSLEICFIDIFERVERLVNNIGEKVNKESILTTDTLYAPYKERPHNYQYYSCEIKEGKLRVFLKDVVYPLDGYQIQTRRNDHKICEKFTRYHKKHYPLESLFFYEFIDTIQFPWHQYKALTEEFNDYLEHRLKSFPFNSPYEFRHYAKF